MPVRRLADPPAHQRVPSGGQLRPGGDHPDRAHVVADSRRASGAAQWYRLEYAQHGRSLSGEVPWRKRCCLLRAGCNFLVVRRGDRDVEPASLDGAGQPTFAQTRQERLGVA
jgi:hypothetical protein